jgi:AbrB family looped-hinge helix DNA binding protein
LYENYITVFALDNAVTHHLLEKMKYYGDTVIGEKGQIVVPADMRKKFGIELGDKFLVLAGEKVGA